MDWDNLRFFLELARTGTLVGAAGRLGVDHTTVARRVQALEKETGTLLFSRESGGHRLTEAGRSLQPQVEAMESASLAIESPTPRSPGGLTGVVRIGATEGFGTLMLAPRLAHFASQHPDLVIDLLAVPRQVHLSRREADIVIALERPLRGPLVVVRLTEYALRLYASKQYLAGHPDIRTREDLRDHRFVGYVDDLLYSKELQYLAELGPPNSFALRSTSILAQCEAVVAGAGVAVLPAFMADRDTKLRCILPAEVRFIRSFWMFMPAESKHLARMRAVWEFLRHMTDELQPVLLPSN